MIEFNFQTLILFGFGCLGALIPKFLDAYYDRKIKKKRKKLKKADYFWEGSYIFIGGVVAIILTPSNELHALIFGATWESLILAYIKKFGGEK